MLRIGAILVLAASIPLGMAQAASRPDLVDLSCYRRPNGEPDWAALKLAYNRGELAQGCSRKDPARRELTKKNNSTSATVPQVQAVRAAPTQMNADSTNSKDSTDSTDSTDSSFKLLLRKDFSDIYLFTNVTQDDQAEGAGLSWTRNNVNQDTVWAVDGMLALAYSYLSSSYGSPIIGASIAPYLKVDKEVHSNPTNDDVDILTAGGSGEIGFQNPLGLRGADYFRIRWGATEDHVMGTRTAQTTGEWIPTYLRLRGEIPSTRLNINFRPELKVQYDTQNEGQLPLAFSGQQRALRVGPEATLLLNVLTSGLTLPSWLATLSSFTGKITYHWWTETYSGRSSSWLTASLIYNLDKDGKRCVGGKL